MSCSVCNTKTQITTFSKWHARFLLSCQILSICTKPLLFYKRQLFLVKRPLVRLSGYCPSCQRLIAINAWNSEFVSMFVVAEIGRCLQCFFPPQRITLFSCAFIEQPSMLQSVTTLTVNHKAKHEVKTLTEKRKFPQDSMQYCKQVNLPLLLP